MTTFASFWSRRKTNFGSIFSIALSRSNIVRAQSPLRVACLTALTTLILPPFGAEPAESPREFRWAGDPEGGAPFVEADPAQPDKLVGFDVEIADLIARRLGRQASFINITFTSIDQSIERGDAEIGLSGIEDTPARRAAMAPTVPYYRFREVLSVRDGDATRFAHARRSARPAGRHLGRHDRLRNIAARRARVRHPCGLL